MLRVTVLNKAGKVTRVETCYRMFINPNQDIPGTLELEMEVLTGMYEFIDLKDGFTYDIEEFHKEN